MGEGRSEGTLRTCCSSFDQEQIEGPPRSSRMTSNLRLESPLIVMVLYQDRTAINDNGLPSAESFLHQEQISLRDLGSFADSANRETFAHAFV
jgi:hypothetical protein